MADIIEAFQSKTKSLIEEMTAILEEIEADPNKNSQLQEADRDEFRSKFDGAISRPTAFYRH